MLFEDIMFLIMGGVTFFWIVLPSYRFLKSVMPHNRNPLEEAREKLEQARLEAEAARLHQETEKLHKQTEEVYDHLYEDTLQDEEETENRRKL